MQMLRMLDIDALDVPEQIPHGDMPGDGVTIGQDNIERAKTVLSAIQGTLERRLEEFQAQGWAEKTAEGRWRFTPKGFLVSNQLIGDLLDRQEQASWEDLIRPRQDQT